jgi:hypothetical protein
MNSQTSPFIETGIDPLLADLSDVITLQHIGVVHPARPALQCFIRTVFSQAHGAEVSAFYPNLLGFSVEQQMRAVVGYRDGRATSLFSEQYLDQPAHELAAARLGLPVAREDMVEVGNLAIADPGQARWVISASTAFLAAAGYRWVLFTANRPLANAFSRLGLKPLALADASPDRLPDHGAAWGTYYNGEPKVYLGDIHAGVQKLHSSGLRRPNLLKLLHAAQLAGAELASSHRTPVAAMAGAL